MTLLQLRYAVALERHGHFRLAAEACHVTQPALSAGVQSLEAELGAVLFDRSSHPIQPTDLGRRVVEQGRTVLAEAQRLEDLVSEATGELAGELRIGILSTLAPYLIPLTIAPFARRYPGPTHHFLSRERRFGHRAVRALHAPLLEPATVGLEGPFAYRSTGTSQHGFRPPVARQGFK